METARKLRPSTARRREEILNAAEAAFLEHGVLGASTRMIAARAGLSQPSLYAHFPTRDALVEALSARAFERLADWITHLEAQADPTPGPELLESMIRSYIAFALAEPDAYRIAFMLEGHSVSPEEAFRKPGMPVFERFAGHVGTLAQAGVLAADDPGVVAQCLWAGMHGLCALLLARASFPWAEQRHLIDAHVALLMAGVVHGRFNSGADRASVPLP